MNPITRSSRLILLGPPCCGKGTLAQRLVQEFDSLFHLSTGEIFRSHLNDGTPFGLQIAQCMQEGKLIPDQLVSSITLNKLKSIAAAAIGMESGESGFILDGFPRTLAQAEELHRFVGPVDVFHLDASDETVIQRLTGRLTCGACGSIFNILFSPPKQEGLCDSCNGDLVHRADDTREIAVERLNVYHEHADRVLSFYEDLGVVRHIETGDLKPDEIFHRVLESEQSSIVSKQ